MRYFVLTILLLILASCTAVAPSEPFRTLISAQGLDNNVVMVVEGDTATFNVHSETGIGNANVLLQVGNWPEAMRLHYHLTGLEEMVFTYGLDTAVTINVSSLGDNEVWQSVTRSGKTEPISPDSPYWMPVTIQNEDGSSGTVPLDKGIIEVTVSQDFYDQYGESFHISWIDFYR